MKKLKLFVLILIGSSLIISCGKPTTPETVPVPDISGGYKIVSEFQTTAAAHDVMKKDGLLYIAQGEGGLIIVDASDAANPQTVSITTDGVKGYCTKITMKDSAVYLGAGSFGVTVVDAGDLIAPYVTNSNLPMKPARGFHILGDYLFTAISEQGIQISEIGYPTEPNPKGPIYTASFAYGITTTSDTTYLFVASGEMGFYMYNISNFHNGYPVYWESGWVDTPGKAEVVTIIEEEEIAFMACGTEGLQIIDYSDTTDIHIVGSLDVGGYAKDLEYKDQIIFMGAGLGGLQIIDVSDYSDPKLLGIVEMEYALGLDVDDDYVYVADDDLGLIIVSRPE